METCKNLSLDIYLLIAPSSVRTYVCMLQALLLFRRGGAYCNYCSRLPCFFSSCRCSYPSISCRLLIDRAHCARAGYMYCIVCLHCGAVYYKATKKINSCRMSTFSAPVLYYSSNESRKNCTCTCPMIIDDDVHMRSTTAQRKQLRYM